MNFILNICIENIFIHSVGFEKTIFFSFEVDKMLIMVQLNLTKFLMTYALYVIFKKIFATPIRKIFFCNFFKKSIIVLLFIIKSSIHLN